IVISKAKNFLFFELFSSPLAPGLLTEILSDCPKGAPGTIRATSTSGPMCLMNLQSAAANLPVRSARLDQK
ncbi:MAG: hypothetical protein WCK28_20880, partial [Burkholderiales bacterium]